MISVYRITLGIRTGFLSITEKPNKTGIFCNPRNWARGVPARRSSVTATMAPKNQPSSGTREYGFQRFRNRDLPRPEFAPFPLSPPIRRLVSHLANRLTHRERRCGASGQARPTRGGGGGRSRRRRSPTGLPFLLRQAIPGLRRACSSLACAAY